MTYEISRDPKANKAIINLRGRDSEKYTKLANRIEQLQELETEIKDIKKAIKSETKELIGDLFEAEDTVFTRVVETVSVVFTMSKDPKPTESVSYAKVLTALTEHLTPELIEKLEELKKAYTSTSQREPSLSIKREFVDNSQQQLLNYCYTIKQNFQYWAQAYDRKLNQIKQMLPMVEDKSPHSLFNSINESLKSVYHESFKQILTEASYI